VIVGVVQILIRDGFDLTRHPLSLMSNGDLGWIQVASFLLSGALVLCAAVGMRRVLRPGVGERWAPILLGVYGVALIGAGIFRADPVDGFPPGTPVGPPTTMSTSGMLHFLLSTVGFLALVAATFVMARRFGKLGRRGWSVFSIVTGVLFLAGFAGIAAGSAVLNVGFALAVVLAWAWVTAVAADSRSIPAGERPE
jgi:hypothetical membrane protein